MDQPPVFKQQAGGDYGTVEQNGIYGTIEQDGDYGTIEQDGDYGTIEQDGDYGTIEQDGDYIDTEVAKVMADFIVDQLSGKSQKARVQWLAPWIHRLGGLMSRFAG